MKRYYKLGNPLISCVMPTFGRPDYVCESLNMFLEQDYENKELIILNDCEGQEFAGDFPNVTIVNEHKRWGTLGEKRNAAIRHARGDYIAVWDDDDVYLPWRLSYCMNRILSKNITLYCPHEYWAYWGNHDLHNNQAVLTWIYHPQVIFKKSEWEAVGGYPAITLHEDTSFIRRILSLRKSEWTPDPIAAHHRVMILRGKSKYQHASIDGGVQRPDTSPGQKYLVPSSIADPILAEAKQKCINLYVESQSRYQKLEKTLNQMHEQLREKGSRYLDGAKPLHVSVGYGELGIQSRLGYEGKSVSVLGRSFSHSFSAHAPSRLVFEILPQEKEFSSLVSINDDVSENMASADFFVLSHGEILGIAKDVRPHETPRLLTASVKNCTQIELIAVPQKWEYCHTVWIDPIVTSHCLCDRVNGLEDCLGRSYIQKRKEKIRKKSCFVTVASEKFSHWLDDLLGSIRKNSQCDDAGMVVFSIGDSRKIREVAKAYEAEVIPCHPLKPLSMSTKSVLYSAGRVVDADNIICIDADMLVLGSLHELFSAIDVAPIGSILVCQEANWEGHSLGKSILSLYKGSVTDIEEIALCRNRLLSEYRLTVNDGVFAAKKVSLNALDAVIRSFHRASEWIDKTGGVPWRNQAIFNLGLAYLGAGQELDCRFNVQLTRQNAHLRYDGGRIVAKKNFLPVSIVHFNGMGRGKFPEFRGKFCRIKNH